MSGCRAVVNFEELYNGGHAIDVYDIAYVLNIETTSGRPVWMVGAVFRLCQKCTDVYDQFSLKGLQCPCSLLPQDYVLVVPAEQYNEEIIEILPIDSSGAFINECGDDNFHVEYEFTIIICTQRRKFCIVSLDGGLNVIYLVYCRLFPLQSKLRRLLQGFHVCPDN